MGKYDIESPEVIDIFAGIVEWIILAPFLFLMIPLIILDEIRDRRKK